MYQLKNVPDVKAHGISAKIDMKLYIRIGFD